MCVCVCVCVCVCARAGVLLTTERGELLCGEGVLVGTAGGYVLDFCWILRGASSTVYCGEGVLLCNAGCVCVLEYC